MYRVARSRARLILRYIPRLKTRTIVPKKMILTYIDAQDWPPPTSDDLWSEQPVVERTRACTRLASQAKTLVCPCRSCTQYAALGGEDAHYSWSHTASSGHICHRRHPKKTLTKENY